MDLKQTLREYASQPLTHQLLVSLLKGYKRPNDKIHVLLDQGILKSVKKGLYIAGPELNAGTPEPFLLANHILGPSYVSIESALSYYGMIPERVHETLSVTTKASRRYRTPAGVFSFIRAPLPYYSFGIRSLQGKDNQFIMIASPEKALFDKIVTTPGVILRSRKDSREYFQNSLRIEADSLKELDTGIMKGWVQESPKRESLLNAVKSIEAS